VAAARPSVAGTEPPPTAHLVASNVCTLALSPVFLFLLLYVVLLLIVVLRTQSVFRLLIWVLGGGPMTKVSDRGCCTDDNRCLLLLRSVPERAKRSGRADLRWQPATLPCCSLLGPGRPPGWPDVKPPALSPVQRLVKSTSIDQLPCPAALALSSSHSFSTRNERQFGHKGFGKLPVTLGGFACSAPAAHSIISLLTYPFARPRSRLKLLVSSPAALNDAQSPEKAASPSPAPAADKAAEAPSGGAPPSDAAEDEDDASLGIASSGAVVDMDVFGQLLEIDDDDTHEFSKMLAFDYITQAESTFEEIEKDL
jgi:hypothetical protein